MRLAWILCLALSGVAVAGNVTETIPPSRAYCNELPTGIGNGNLRRTALSFQGASCGEYLVQCPDVDAARYYTLFIGPREGAGTILSVSGERGDTFHVENLQEYADSGFLAVAVALKKTGRNDASLCASHNCPEFVDANEPGPREASCRIASILEFLHADKPLPTCAQGHSAGSSELAYALAYRGTARLLPYVQLTAWTPFARPDYGCAASQGRWRSYTGTNPDGSVESVDRRAYAYRDTTRLAAGLAEDIFGLRRGAYEREPTELELRRLEAQAIVTPDANYKYPGTTIDAFACLSSTSMVDGNGSWWWDEVAPANAGHAFMQGLDPGTQANSYCMGEEVWWKKNGSPSPIRQLTIDRMIDLCR